VQNVIQVREASGRFVSFEDFCTRVDLRIVNRKVLECLVKCGAFDSLGQPRAVAFAAVEYQMSRASSVQRDKERGQTALFDVEPVNARLAVLEGGVKHGQSGVKLGWPHRRIG
jgi:DNA polymerase-3 subunit alpha